MRDKEPVKLSNLYEGAVLEAVDYELANVFANIQDPNTSATQMRKVTLEIKLKPNKERTTAELSFQASSKLAPAEELATTLLLDQAAGEYVGFELQQGTGELPLPLEINKEATR